MKSEIFKEKRRFDYTSVTGCVGVSTATDNQSSLETCSGLAYDPAL